MSESRKSLGADEHHTLVRAIMEVLEKTQSYGLQSERELRVLVTAAGVLAIEAGVTKERLLASVNQTYDHASSPRALGEA